MNDSLILVLFIAVPSFIILGIVIFFEARKRKPRRFY
jgi:hypothetical protein